MKFKKKFKSMTWDLTWLDLVRTQTWLDLTYNGVSQIDDLTWLDFRINFFQRWPDLTWLDSLWQMTWLDLGEKIADLPISGHDDLPQINFQTFVI